MRSTRCSIRSNLADFLLVAGPGGLGGFGNLGNYSLKLDAAKDVVQAIYADGAENRVLVEHKWNSVKADMPVMTPFLRDIFVNGLQGSRVSKFDDFYKGAFTTVMYKTSKYNSKVVHFPSIALLYYIAPFQIKAVLRDLAPDHDHDVEKVYAAIARVLVNAQYIECTKSKCTKSKCTKSKLRFSSEGLSEDAIKYAVSLGNCRGAEVDKFASEHKELVTRYNALLLQQFSVRQITKAVIAEMDRSLAQQTSRESKGRSLAQQTSRESKGRNLRAAPFRSKLTSRESKGRNLRAAPFRSKLTSRESKGRNLRAAPFRSKL